MRTIFPLSELQPRLRRVGKIRLGHKVAGETKEGKKYTRPDKLEFFRFTSADKSSLEHVAKMYGGEVRPWADEPGQFELISTSNEVYIELLPGQTFLPSYEFYNAGGRLRKCDGVECEMVVNGEMVYKPCVCYGIANEKDKCSFIQRLDVKLAGTTNLGIWTMETSSMNAAREMPTMIAALLAAAQGSLALCILALEFRETKVPGEKTKQYYVPTLRVRQGMAADLAARGGQSLGAMLAGEYAQMSALSAGAPALAAPAAAIPAPAAAPEMSDEQKALMIRLSEMGLASKTQLDQFQAFKEICADRDWVTVLTAGLDKGLKSWAMLREFAKGESQ